MADENSDDVHEHGQHRPRRHRPVHTRHVLSPHRAVGRLVLSVTAGLVVGALIPSTVPWVLRVILGWDVLALTLLVQSWMIILRSTPQSTEQRAGVEDPGGAAVFVIAVLGSVFSLFAVTFALQTASAQNDREIWVPLILIAIALSWWVTHTAYTLRYAHLYYREKVNGGLVFPGTQQPDDMDFAYFAFTLGMCFQVSDVPITSSKIRRTCLAHCLISFIFNTAILAFSLNFLSNLVAG
jgi:uncharacterized membrane protein